MLTNDQINFFKNELINQQTALIESTQDEFGLSMSHTDAVGELSSIDNHPGDMGTELFERGKDLALSRHAEDELEAINKALHAMEDRTYGICRVCSQDIPFERLQAMPAADTCVAHASDNLAMHERPIEETVLYAQLNPPTEADASETGYDAEDTWQAVSEYGTSDTPSDLYGDQENYNEMYPNSDEDIGYVEDVEKYASTNFE